MVIRFGVPEGKSEVSYFHGSTYSMHRYCLVETPRKRRNLRVSLVTRGDILPANAIKRGRST